MTAQQGKTTTKGAEGLDGENGCKEISAFRCSPTTMPPREIVHLWPFFSATEIGVSGERARSRLEGFGPGREKKDKASDFGRAK
jgi:hypothetical protein